MVDSPMNQRPKLTFASFIEVLKSTKTAFGEDKVGRHAAALAYFTVFSLSPLLIVVISIAALYFRDQAQAVGAISAQIRDTVGPTAAKAIEEMIQAANGHGGNTAKPITATIVALAVALWGASGLFGALQDSLNTIWGVMPKSGLSFLVTIRERFISFAMVLGVGFLLLVSLIATTALSAISHQVSGSLGGDSKDVAWGINFVLGLIVSTLLFAAIYKILPDAKIDWRDVWVGAFVTSLLFTIGRLALGVYLGRPGTASAFGSAGALVVLLLWVNYAATILFVGAEFTKCYASKFGSKIEPDDDAVAVMPADRAKEGMAPAPTHGGAASGAKSPGLSPAPALLAAHAAASQNAVSSEKRKQDLEHALSVVAGAGLVVLWVLRRHSREKAEVESA
jgi:membrane protein